MSKMSIFRQLYFKLKRKNLLQAIKNYYLVNIIPDLKFKFKL